MQRGGCCSLHGLVAAASRRQHALNVALLLLLPRCPWPLQRKGSRSSAVRAAHAVSQRLRASPAAAVPAGRHGCAASPNRRRERRGRPGRSPRRALGLHSTKNRAIFAPRGAHAEQPAPAGVPSSGCASWPAWVHTSPNCRRERRGRRGRSQLCALGHPSAKKSRQIRAAHRPCPAASICGPAATAPASAGRRGRALSPNVAPRPMW